jgi:hypothetical protein
MHAALLGLIAFYGGFVAWVVSVSRATFAKNTRRAAKPRSPHLTQLTGRNL